MSAQLSEHRGVRVAIEGCGHGELVGIYSSIEKAAAVKGWTGVDLVIICGDFQAVRNSLDLNCMSVPRKYRQLGDFHAYYSGERQAPYLTIFVGGNHEASNHLFELYYGGWVAPNIYYAGAANVLRFGPLRIACMSGIWKGFDYRKPHHERLPYSQDDVKSIYHVRELDVRKLLQIRSQVDIGLSHDWPRNVQWHGDSADLFRKKPLFEEDATTGKLGNVAAESVLMKLRPAYWFSGHLHCKFDAFIDHRGDQVQLKSANTGVNGAAKAVAATPLKNDEEIDLDMDMDSDGAEEPTAKAVTKNTDEIDLDLDEDEDDPTAEVDPTIEETPADEGGTADAKAETSLKASTIESASTTIAGDEPSTSSITNNTTRFLALDKIGPHRHFLQLLEIPSINSDQTTITATNPPLKLQYDPEWLAITRAFASELNLTTDATPSPTVPADQGAAHYQTLINEEQKWIETNLVQTDKLNVPYNFEIVAPIQNPQDGVHVNGHPFEYPSPQTEVFCKLIGIENKFAMEADEIRTRNMQAPPQEEFSAPASGRGRGDFRGGGRGRGGFRGGNRGGRGRGGRGFRRG